MELSLQLRSKTNFPPLGGGNTKGDEKKMKGTKMKKWLLSLCMVLALVACKDEKKETTQAEAKPVVKIGITIPLSGDSAEAGKSAATALQMVLDDYNKKGLKYDYKLIIEDNQLFPSKIATTTNKLINLDKVNAILSFWNSETPVLANEKGVFSFNCSGDEATTKGKYNFNNFPATQDSIKLLANELKKNNIKTVAMFLDIYAMRIQYDALAKYLTENTDIKIVFKEYFNPGEKDYRTAIAKASQLNPNIYLYSGFNPSTYIFMKQLKEITGYNENVTSLGIFADMPFKERKIVEGLWYVDNNLDGTEELKKRLLSEHGIISQACTGNSVSNLEILINAYEKANVSQNEIIPNNDSVRNWIFKNVKNFDTLGGIVSVQDDGLFATKSEIKKIINGEPIRIEE